MSPATAAACLTDRNTREVGHGCVADEVDWVRPAYDARQGTLSSFPGSMCAAGTWELTFNSA